MSRHTLGSPQNFDPGWGKAQMTPSGIEPANLPRTAYETTARQLSYGPMVQWAGGWLISTQNGDFGVTKGRNQTRPKPPKPTETLPIVVVVVVVAWSTSSRSSANPPKPTETLPNPPIPICP